MLDADQGTDRHDSSPAFCREVDPPEDRTPSASGPANRPKYLAKPAQTPVHRTRTSKLDPFKPTIQEWLEQDRCVTGSVIQQRLRELGFAGGKNNRSRLRLCVAAGNQRPA